MEAFLLLLLLSIVFFFRVSKLKVIECDGIFAHSRFVSVCGKTIHRMTRNSSNFNVNRKFLKVKTHFFGTAVNK